MKELICIICPRGCHLQVDDELNVTGNNCPRGAIYAKTELTHPTRTLTSTVSIKSEIEVALPVKSDKPLPKEKIFEAMEVINKTCVKAPIKIGDIVVKNIFGLDVNIVATKDILR
jgi:CxxC motif-containing protein